MKIAGHNPRFASLAQPPACPDIRGLENDAPRHLSDKTQKKLADDARLLRAWKKFHREEREAVLAGPHGAVLSEFFRMLENLKHVQPAQLIGLAHAVDWTLIDYSTRLIVLHELNTSITRYRTKRGLESINDPLPGQPETPYRAIKAILFPHVADVAPAEAQLGSDSKTPSKTGHVA